MASSNPSKGKAPSPLDPSASLRIGKIVGCHGLKGELKIRPADDDPDWVDSLETVALVHTKQGQKTFPVLTMRFKERLVYAQLEGLPDRTTAEPWIGAEVRALQADLPEPEAGAYRVQELIGLRVIQQQTGQCQGMVQDVLSSAGSDFLEIRLSDSDHCVVVPFIEVFFPGVDLQKGELLLDKVENLTDLAASS